MTKAERKFNDLMYQRGLADFEFDNYSEGIKWLYENGITKKELLQLGYSKEDIENADLDL